MKGEEKMRVKNRVIMFLILTLIGISVYVFSQTFVQGVTNSALTLMAANSLKAGATIYVYRWTNYNGFTEFVVVIGDKGIAVTQLR